MATYSCDNVTASNIMRGNDAGVGEETIIIAMDENDIRTADRVAEQAVTDRVKAVCSDLDSGRVGSSDQRTLGEALRRANGSTAVGRAIGTPRGY